MQQQLYGETFPNKWWNKERTLKLLCVVVRVRGEMRQNRHRDWENEREREILNQTFEEQNNKASWQQMSAPNGWQMGRIERGEMERKRGGRRGRKGKERNIQETGGAEVMETPLPFPQEGKQFDLSHTKKQHIAKEDISHFPVEGNRVVRSGGWILKITV